MGAAPPCHETAAGGALPRMALARLALCGTCNACKVLLHDTLSM